MKKSWGYALAEDGAAHPVVVAQAASARSKAQFLWIHLDGRAPETVAWLKTRNGLPAAVISALTAIETRPRCDVIGEGALINLRGLGDTPEDDPDPLVSIRLWAEQGRIISVSFRSMAGLPALREKMAAGILHDPGDLIAALAVTITETLDPMVTGLGDVIDDCEATLEASRAFEMRRLIARSRSDAISYRRFVVPQRQALERLAGLDAAWLEEEDRLHLHEAADRFARMAEELEAVRERAALMHEQVTDLRAELIETRTLILAIVALVFLPLTFLTGLLGMNVAGIPFAHAPWAFWGVVAFCAAVAAVIAGYFIRADWFRG